VTEFVWPVRVYYEDTDAGGVVYHTAYLQFMERARTEWLRQLGISHARLLQEENLLFAVVNLEVQYLKPARLDELLQIACAASINGGASADFEQVIRNAGGDALVRGKVRIACLDATQMRPRRLPQQLREEWG
jgi:acyl-CoA thioester hydrolase